MGIVLVTNVNSLPGQTLQLIRSFKVSNTPVQVSTDRQGNLYLGNKNGSIDKYNLQGELLRHFSTQKVSIPSILEAWQGLRIFVFYREYQEYLFLDRFFNPSPRYTFSADVFQFVNLATIGNDEQLWVVDGQDLSLKSMDIHLREIRTDSPLNLYLDPNGSELTYLRSYQNFVFLADKASGILVFDNQGNYLETIHFEGIDFFSFSGDDLVAKRKDKVLFYDISQKTKREIGLPDPSTRFVLVANNNHLITVSNYLVSVYQVN